MVATKQKARRASDDYLDLVRKFPLVPIRSDRHLQDAFKVIDRLSIIDEELLTPGQADYLLVLSDLVEKYEDEHHAIDLSHLDGIAILKHLLEENEMTASDLGRLLGNRQLGTAILRPQRQLSKAHIIRLCERFGVSADLFLRERSIVASSPKCRD
jgi:HTH-type transcriptional regulator / antitoxin HigA